MTPLDKKSQTSFNWAEHEPILNSLNSHHKPCEASSSLLKLG